MVRKWVVGSFACALFVLATFASLPVRAEDVPVAWLDSLEANTWRHDSDSLGYTFMITTLQQKLDKKGEVTKVDTGWTRVVFNEEGKRVFEQLDESGTVTDTRVAEEEEEDLEDDGESMEFSLNPFAAFNHKNRTNYSFAMLPPDGKGRPRIRIEPVGENEGFFGDYTIDSEYWVPLEISGHPSEPPKHVKEMNMTMYFSPDEQGFNLIRRGETTIEASFLLIKIRMRMIQTYSDYKRVR